MFIVNVVNMNAPFLSAMIGQQFITEDFNQGLDWAEELSLQLGWPSDGLRQNLAIDYSCNLENGYGIIITEAE